MAQPGLDREAHITRAGGEQVASHNGDSVKDRASIRPIYRLETELQHRLLAPRKTIRGPATVTRLQPVALSKTVPGR